MKDDVKLEGQAPSAASFGISFRDTPPDAEWTPRFVSTVQNLVTAITQALNLSNLDGITIGFDYDLALASVDLGYESNIAKRYTNKNGLVGVGKTLRVRRGGVVRIHVVLNGEAIFDLVEHEPETEEFWRAANLIAHELGHVKTAAWFEGHSPGVMLAKHDCDWALSILRDAAHGIWEEYAACRLSAGVSRGNLVTDIYTETLECSMAGAVEHARSAIKAHYEHRDATRLLVETLGAISTPLNHSMYLMGHLEGLEQEIDIDRFSSSTGELAPYLSDALIAVRKCWENKAPWNGLAGLDPIIDVLVDAMKMTGLALTLNQEPPGSSFSVIYSAATLPNGEADMEIIRMKRTLGIQI
ncbi:hypothetical protein [Pseudomonas coronafaciens]|nr:hypothetical protein [Pseudomonas coronafaciens]QIQ69879.1 hypothetical protein HBB04_00220 [Pseudomonas coronafaciens]